MKKKLVTILLSIFLTFSAFTENNIFDENIEQYFEEIFTEYITEYINEQISELGYGSLEELEFKNIEELESYLQKYCDDYKIDSNELDFAKALETRKNELKK